MAAFGAALDALQHVGRGGPGPAKKGAGPFTSSSGMTSGPTLSLIPPGGTGKIVNATPQTLSGPQQAVNRSAVSGRAGAGRNGGRFDFDDGGTYCGGWEMGKAEGFGLCTGPKGKGEFSGLWRSGFESSGVYTWPNGYTYEGDWQGGKRHGLGLETRARWIYAGEWTAGLKGRYGVRVNIPSSSQQFQDGPQNAGATTNTTSPYGLGGQGDASVKTVMAASAFESAAAAAKYEGTWANGLQDGYGTETYADGSTFQGQFLRGVRHGYGVRKSVPYGLASAQRTMLPLPNPGVIPGITSDEDDRSGAVPFWERDQRLEVRGGFVLKADCWSEAQGPQPDSVKGVNKLADMLGAVGRRKGASVTTGLPPEVTRGCSLDRSGGRSVTLTGGDKGGARRSSKLAQTLRKALSTSSQTKLGGGARGPGGGASSTPDVIFADGSPYSAATSTATAFKFKIPATTGQSGTNPRYGTNPRQLISSESVESSYSAGSAPPSCTSGLDKNSRLYHLDSNLSFVSQDDIVDPGITETYSGEWKNDKRSGFGICERSDGLKYEGEWLENKKHGYGVTCLPDGSRLAGKYKSNLLITSYPLSSTNVKSFFRSFSPHHSSSSNSLHNITNTSVTPSGKTRANRHKSPNPFFFLANRNASKLKEKVDSAVSHALRAAGLSAQKAEIAAVRRLTAQEKAQQAESAAVKARNNSDLARLNAKKYAPDFHQPGTEFLKKRLKERSNIFGAGAKMSLPEPVKEEIYGSSGKPLVNKAVQTKGADGETFQIDENDENNGLHYKPSKKGGGIIKGLIQRSRSLYSRKGGTNTLPGVPTLPISTPNGSVVRESQARPYLKSEEQTDEVSGVQRSRTGSEDVSLTYTPSSHPKVKVSPPQLTIRASNYQMAPRPKETSLKGTKARAGLIEGGIHRHIRCIKPDPGNAQFFDHYGQYVEEEALSEVPKPSCTLSLDRDRDARGRSRGVRRRNVRSDTLPTIVVPLQNISTKLASAIIKRNLCNENPSLIEEEDTVPPTSAALEKESNEIHKSFVKEVGTALNRRPSIAERGGSRYRISPTKHLVENTKEEYALHSPPVTLSAIAEATTPAAKVLMIRPPIVVSGRQDDTGVHYSASNSRHNAGIKDRNISPVGARRVGIKKNILGRSKSPIPRRGSLPDVSALDIDHVPGEWSRENISKLSSQRRREINRMKEELQKAEGHNVLGYYIKRLVSRLMFPNHYAPSPKFYSERRQTAQEGSDEMRSQLTATSHDQSSFQDPLDTKRSKIRAWIWFHKGILLLFVFNVSLIAIFYYLLTT